MLSRHTCGASPCCCDSVRSPRLLYIYPSQVALNAFTLPYRKSRLWRYRCFGRQQEVYFDFSISLDILMDISSTNKVLISSFHGLDSLSHKTSVRYGFIVILWIWKLTAGSTDVPTNSNNRILLWWHILDTAYIASIANYVCITLCGAITRPCNNFQIAQTK